VTALQLLIRGLIAAVVFLVPIVCAEEMPAGSRSYTIALMIIPGGLGVGMVVWMIPLMDVTSGAWRFVFALSALGGLLGRHAINRLPETERFEHDVHDPSARSHQHIAPWRLAVLGAALLLLNMQTAPTQQLQNDYLISERGFSGAKVMAFVLLTNTWGAIGLAIGSRLSDRVSRRLAARIGLCGLAIGNSLMFTTGGPAMWVFSTIGSVVGALVAPSLGAMLPEMFPTLRRGYANGLLNGAGVLGSVIGLAFVGHYLADNYGNVMVVLGAAPLVVAAFIGLLPETAGVELEAINVEDPEAAVE
jgi:predicted MFS family arabinose efflux permease